MNPTNGAPTAYPSVYWGCHYGNCTPGFAPLPAGSSQFAGLNTSVSMSYPAGGNWDAAYDIWFDPTARTDGQNTGAEVMVWLNHSGPPQPVGSKVATVSLAGGSWDVWEGNIGWNVISYVRTPGTASADFAVSTFYNDAVARGFASDRVVPDQRSGRVRTVERWHRPDREQLRGRPGQHPAADLTAHPAGWGRRLLSGVPRHPELDRWIHRRRHGEQYRRCGHVRLESQLDLAGIAGRDEYVERRSGEQRQHPVGDQPRLQRQHRTG